jgi:DNA-binding transcriptional ArsR family regulator
MDELDEAILAALIDGNPRSFHQLLETVDLSHNTLRLHLDHLLDQALVTREKITKKGRGRPSFTYSLNLGRRGVASPLLGVSGDAVTLPFSRLGQVRRFEKGRYCRKIRGSCEARNRPQILKGG